MRGTPRRIAWDATWESQGTPQGVAGDAACRHHSQRTRFYTVLLRTIAYMRLLLGKCVAVTWKVCGCYLESVWLLLEGVWLLAGKCVAVSWKVCGVAGW